MEKFNTSQFNYTSNFMLGAMLNTMAVVDMTGLLNYAIKAIIGGFIWLAFKLFSDRGGDSSLGMEYRSTLNLFKRIKISPTFVPAIGTIYFSIELYNQQKIVSSALSISILYWISFKRTD